MWKKEVREKYSELINELEKCFINSLYPGYTEKYNLLKNTVSLIRSVAKHIERGDVLSTIEQVKKLITENNVQASDPKFVCEQKKFNSRYLNELLNILNKHKPNINGI